MDVKWTGNRVKIISSILLTISSANFRKKQRLVASKSAGGEEVKSHRDSTGDDRLYVSSDDAHDAEAERSRA